MALFGNKKPLGLFRDLVMVAAADGNITEAEGRTLSGMGAKLGLNGDDIQKVLTKPQKIKYVPPKDQQEKIRHLLMCVHVMMADGEIDRREMDLCMTIAGKMGLPPALVQRMVVDFVRHIAAAVKAQAAVRRAARTGDSGLEAEIDDFLRSRA